MKYLAIIQARVSSTRLPGKVLKEVCGKPLLELQYERVLRSKKINKTIFATSSNLDDDPIETICNDIGAECFRGSLDNVLERYYKAAEIYKPENIVRLTGDCPLIEPTVIDDVITYYEDEKYDYATNAIEPTFPDGLDVEVFSFDCLKKTYSKAELPSEKEHVTTYIPKDSDFSIGHYKTEEDLSHLRWTVDEPEDFVLIKSIYESLYPTNRLFNYQDVLAFLKVNGLSDLNSHIVRNEGKKSSYLKDIQYLKNK